MKRPSIQESVVSESLKDPKSAHPQNEPAGGWPGGWYIYENGKVDGPFAAADAFGRAAEAGDGKPRLVSRKGFSQWYALKDLSEIFRMTEHLGQKVQGQQEITETQIARFRADTAPATPPAAAASTQAGVPPLQRVRRKQIESPSLRPARPLAAEPAAQEPKIPAKLPSEAPPARIEAAAPPKSAPATRLTDPRRAPGSAAQASPHNAAMREYFLVRNRLRLGRIRNPWVSAFVGAPLSLGIYWAVWVTKLSHEIVWHTQQTKKDESLVPGLLAAIPLVHFYAVFKLAHAMRRMESQNRYTSVSPLVACLFAIFPPFALAYLQDAANRHWLLHVKFSMTKPKEAAS
jgi:hypothetical protein